MIIRRQKRSSWLPSTSLLTAAAAAAGVILAYFLDPDRGRSRRAQVADRLAGVSRRAWRGLNRALRRMRAEGYGIAAKATHLTPSETSLNDPTLAHKVETELFRDPGVPKGRINVMAENGVILLHGTVDSEGELNAIVAKVKAIAGVRDVQSLLHLPDEPVPVMEPEIVGRRGW